MPVFPSVEWFNTVRDIFNADESFQSAGGETCDATVGVKSGWHVFFLVFEGFECTEAREGSDEDLEDADFYMEMEPGSWQEMLVNIKDNGGADLNHTLNTIDLNRPDGLSQTMNDDQFRQDLFFRYNQTFQYFFDASARIETQFQPSVASSNQQ